MADTTASTSTLTVTAAALGAQQAGQLVEWIFSLVHVPVPDNVALIIGTAVIPVVHVIYKNWLTKIGATTTTGATS